MLSPLIPPALDAQTAVRVSFDAGAVDMQDVDAGVEVLRGHGWPVVYDAAAHGPHGYLAAPDDVRIRDILHGLEAPNVGALWSARGGYGCTRILDRLPQNLRQNPKWFIGYSDITALHLWANAQGVASVHAPLVSGLSKHGKDAPALLRALNDIVRTHQFPAFSELQPLHLGRSSGRLLGGNLSLIQTLIGTPYLPSLDGVILFVEEIAESAYRVDRLLSSLLLGGRAKGIRGIVFGDFTNCRGLEDHRLRPRLQEWSHAFGCPVVMGFPAGHGLTNRPFVLGIDYDLDALAGTLTPRDRATDEDQAATPANTQAATPAITPQRLLVPNAKGFERGAGFFPATRTAAGGIVHALQHALENGVATGIQLVASHKGQRTHSIAVGTTGLLHDVACAPVTPRTMFDLASLTKPLSTAIQTFQHLESSETTLQSTANFAGSPTLEELLSHRAGFVEWGEFYTAARRSLAPGAPLPRSTDSRVLEAAWLQKLRALEPAYPDRRCAYSDVGYMFLGLWLDRLSQRGPQREKDQRISTLSRRFDAQIAQVLGLQRTGFRPLEPSDDGSRTARFEPRDFAATEWCPWRKRTLQGIVHDEHCQLLGGEAGHAGLFGTAVEVDAIAQSLLGYGPQILTPASIDAMWSKPTTIEGAYGAIAVDPADGAYTRGWDTPTASPSNAGSLMTPEATVGHLGYAGTSLWIDRDREIAITLLTNRVHPTRESEGIRAFRPLIHDLVMRELL